MMKVELHLHTNRYSACATHSPTEAIAQLVQAGYEAVYITEHNTVWTQRQLDTIQKKFSQIKIFGGVELTYKPLQHLLVLGTCDPEYEKIASDMAAVLDKARSEGHLTILAHPFRCPGAADMLGEGHKPDAIEHLSCNQEQPMQAWKSQLASEELGLRLVNSGDSHSLDFIDRYWIETHHPIESADDIRQIVLENNYDNHKRDLITNTVS